MLNILGYKGNAYQNYRDFTLFQSKWLSSIAQTTNAVKDEGQKGTFIHC
jgi:hypothetical protein